MTNREYGYDALRPMTGDELARLYPRDKLLNAAPHFEPMQEAGLGVDAQDSKLASDFAELSAESNRRTDRLVNWLAVALVMVIAALFII